MEKGNLTGRQLRKSLKLQNIGGDGLKPKKVRIYTPNLNVVRRKQKTDAPQRTTPAGTERTVERNRVKKNVQTPDVFFEGSSNFHSFKRLRNHKATDLQIPAKKSKKRTILSSSDEEDTPKCPIENIEESQKIEVEEKVFALEPVELQNNLKKNFGCDVSYKLLRYQRDSEEVKVEEKEKESILPLPFMSSKLYSKDRPALMVFKMPDFIATKGTGNTKTSKQVGLPLKDVNPGKLGKLMIRRSGRMQIQIGRIRYDMDDVNFLTEMTQVANFSNVNGEPNLFNLGCVQKWLNIVPAWDDLVVK